MKRLEALWVYIQAFTIVFLVHSPMLVGLLPTARPIEIVLEEGPTPVQIHMEDIMSLEAQLEELTREPEPEPEPPAPPPATKKTVKKHVKPAPVAKKVTPEPKPQVKDSAVAVRQNPALKTPPKRLPFFKKLFTKKAGAEKKGRSKKRKGCKAYEHSSIQKIGSRNYKIDKKSFHSYLNDLGKARRLASVYWYKNKEDKVVGILVKGIPCKSPLRQMGIKPGDILVSVNNTKTTDIVGSYLNLKLAKKLNIVIKRKNRTLRLQYRLVKDLG